ncbi:MAG: DUF1236 domain-containing protein [Methyloceanibacter sp.]
MTNRLMMSVAAIALIAGTGLANAQATGGRESGGAATQQTAPSTAPAASEPQSGMKSTQSDQKAPGATKSQRAEDNMPGQKSKGMSSENETKGQAKDMKAEGREGHGNNMKAEGREGRDNNMKAEGRESRDNNMKAEGKNGNTNAETKGTERSQTTVGVAGAGAQLSTEQRTKITSVIREQRVAPVTNVNFSISVGTRIPSEVRFHPLPAAVVTVYPEWRGYDYVLVRDQILVIDPRSHEIVAILDV